MKRIVFLLAVLPLLFAGCSKDDEDDGNPLKGTKWVSEQILNNGEPGTETITFGDQDVTIEARTNDGLIGNTVHGTYTYNPPTIVILFSFNGQSVSLHMTLDGNKIKYENDGKTYIYNKQ
ncbi:MAG: DUF4923 family protein [Bacteroidales bacterium]|jgi:hypothetical protein|nr:DUF4923 family protein [Bacteroidales bacterium]